METFTDLERKFDNAPVHFQQGNNSGAGMIRLARQESLVILSTTDYFPSELDENGWFDVDLVSNSGGSIWLHNAALNNSFESHQVSTTAPGHFESHIFPNTVVLNCHYLPQDRTILVVTFSLAALSNFFHYELIEWETFHPATRNSEPMACRLVVPVKWTPQPQKRDDFPLCDANGVVPPTIAYAPPVKYPPLAVRLNHQGIVVIDAVIGTDGHASDEVVTKPTGFLELDQVALDRTAQEVFHPAMMSGKPIACHLTVRVNWNLTSGPPDAQK
ncbi:MAG TPA: energy transducer TonB [Rhizomicrobium sp.]|jgi:TonB family protein